METLNNVYIRYKLNEKILTTEEVEENKHLFNPKCFNSSEKVNAILKLREEIKNTSAILYIHQDFTFSHELI